MSPSPPDLTGATGPVADAKLTAGVDFIRRTGSKTFQLRYSDDEQPVVWIAVAGYPDERHEVDASLDPIRAVLRLCERLADGGQCVHCGRPTGLDPDTIETMPLNDLICWYQFDPELRTFRRGCEGNERDELLRNPPPNTIVMDESEPRP